MRKLSNAAIIADFENETDIQLNDKQREEFDKVLNNYTEIDQKAEEELTEVFFERII